MTPGPTRIPDDVQMSMAKVMINPDVDPEFGTLYRSILDDVATLYDTEHDIVILGGEGILGLEAAVASTVSPGDQVLCIANGLYGDGFADFVEMYGGEPVIAQHEYDEPIDPAAVESLLDEHDDISLATMVHCETPTGVLNDLDPILEVLENAGVLSIVDAVSSLAGTPVPVDDIDICLGASQKCLSAPPGLTTVTVSDRAWEHIESTPQRSFYASLEPWKDVEVIDDIAPALPYTHLVSNLYALEAAVSRLLDEGRDSVFERHRDAARYCREMGDNIGLESYAPESLTSPTVTAFHVPGEAQRITQAVYEQYNLLLATSLGPFADDILRVGHMGYGADREAVGRTMQAIEAVY